MNDVDFQIFAHLVLGLDSTHNGMSTGSKGHMQHDRFFVNMLFADFAMITNLHPVIHNEIADVLKHSPAVPFFFLGLRPSPQQTFTEYGGAMIQFGKPLVNHVETLYSSDNDACRCQKLTSTHTTYGLPPTLTTHTSSMMTPFAAIPQASKKSSNPSMTPPLPNTYAHPWHRALHASTSY
jgi:hypothetical protein